MCFRIIRLILVSLCLIPVAAKGITASTVLRLVSDKHCSHLSNKTRLLQTSLLGGSVVDCARSCSQEKHCQGIWYLSDKKWIFQCQLFISNTSLNLPQKPNSVESLSHADNAQCYKFERNVPSSVSSPDLHHSNWIVFVDTNDPQTLTESHIKSRENWTSEGKCVVQASSGVYYAFKITLNTNNARGIVTNVIGKDNHGFLNQSFRIMYTCEASGALSESIIDLRRRSRRRKSISVQRLRIFFQETSIDTLQPTDASDLISWLKNGFNIFHYQYAILSEERSAVFIYSINKFIEVERDEKHKIPKHKIPLTYRQMMQEFNVHYYKMKNKLGIANGIISIKELPPMSIALNPLWTSINSDSTDVDGHTAILSQYMSGGHRFRVGFNNGFYDVHDVLQVANDMYFILPQQITTSKQFVFTSRSKGLRAVVSTRGAYASCSHPLEGEGNLGTDFQIVSNVQSFVDKKAWMPVFSIFSNGTSVFGNPSDVADEVLLGKDLNVLIKWLHEDKSRLLTIAMISVEDYNQPNISINAESVISWHLINTSPSMELSPHCNLEKVLVKSNGELEILVYNTKYRAPVFSVSNIQTIWFVN